MLEDREKVLEVTQNLKRCLNTTGNHGMGLESYDDDVDCNEVYPNIVLGDGTTAKNLQFLKKIGITHVLNMAMGSKFCLVDTNDTFYKSSGIVFCGFSINDVPTADISVHFETAAKFIDQALSSGGKVYVHCYMGISRSASCVIAFLMLKRGMTAEEALVTCRAKRFISPNVGFITQLAELDVKLRERRDIAGSNESSNTEMKKKCDLS